MTLREITKVQTNVFQSKIIEIIRIEKNGGKMPLRVGEVIRTYKPKKSEALFTDWTNVSILYEKSGIEVRIRILGDKGS